jgi:hypothetical protein
VCECRLQLCSILDATAIRLAPPCRLRRAIWQTIATRIWQRHMSVLSDARSHLALCFVGR